MAPADRHEGAGVHFSEVQRHELPHGSLPPGHGDRVAPNGTPRSTEVPGKQLTCLPFVKTKCNNQASIWFRAVPLLLFI